MRKNESKVFGKGSGEEPFLRKVCPSRVTQIAVIISDFPTSTTPRKSTLSGG